MPTSPVYFRSGELIHWSPSLAARMLWRGVQIDSRRPKRTYIARHIWGVFKAWFAWTTALPGDRFWDFQRDIIIEVAHGLPGHRKARVVSGFYIAQLGESAFTSTAPEPCAYAWWEVGRQ